MTTDTRLTSILDQDLVDAIEKNYDRLTNHLAQIWPDEQASAIAKKELLAAMTKLLGEW